MNATPSTLPTDTLTLRNGERLTLRPVQPHDDWRLAELINAASEPARRQRFPSAEGRASSARLQALACVDQRRHVALVVTHLEASDAPDETARIVAEARYQVDGDGGSAEFALMVDERWQRRGIGTWLLRALTAHAARAGITGLHGEVTTDDVALLALAKRCRFRATVDPLQSYLVRLAIRLQSPRVPFWHQVVRWPVASGPGPGSLRLLSRK